MTNVEYFVKLGNFNQFLNTWLQAAKRKTTIGVFTKPIGN
jgi:hypothetical protein